MSEVTPQFTYSPEGVLSVHVTYENPEIYDSQQAALHALGEYKGTEIKDGPEQANVSIEIPMALGSRFNNRGDEKVLDFLTNLTRSLPYHPEGSRDRVATLDMVTAAGTFAGIFPQFQRWINADGIPEEVARESIVAMATPFGKAMTNKAVKDFKVHGGSASSWTFGITTHPDRFDIRKQEETADTVVETEGKVQWSWAYLTTLGSCACWGVNGDDRENILVNTDRARLYQMSPHNVDFARQILSHILGLGALTYRAAGYSGQEDLLASAEWGEPRVYPKRQD